MESSAIILAEEKRGGGGEKKAVKTGHDGTTAEVEVDGEMKQLACQGARPFGILPEEIWSKILEEKVESAEDIRNVLRAFPQLDKLFQKKKASCLFALVLPHLMTKHLVAEEMDKRGWTSLRCGELLKLRLVSKRWKNAVDRSLGKHADRHPLMPRGEESDAVAIPEDHFNYHRIRDCPLGATRFEKAQDIDKFLLEMGDFEGNPFPGKSVLLQVYDHNEEDTFRKAVARTVVLLERFGQQVLHLQIDHLGNEVRNVGYLELYRNILKCLTFVPNLRSLIFSGNFFGVEDPERDTFFADPETQNLFPELRNLERFEWRVDFQAESVWITRMLNAYGRKDGLRKLGIPLALLSTAVDLASYQSVHLTELHLFLYNDAEPIIVDLIERVVKALPNHQDIRKFGLSSFDRTFLKPRAVSINDLIRMLAEFKVESVVLNNLDLFEGPPPTPLVPTPEHLTPAFAVTSLDLEPQDELGLGFEFLRELPNLKFLSVKIGELGRRGVLREYRKLKRNGMVGLEVGSFEERLRRYFMKAYEPTLEIPENAGIWKVLPSLEMLSLSMLVVTGEEGEAKYLGVRFVRACGNQAFFGPRPEVVKWDEERVEDQVWERGIAFGLMANGWNFEVLNWH